MKVYAIALCLLMAYSVSGYWNKKTCESGAFMNKQGQCKPCDTNIPHCLRCSSDGIYCYECKDGEHLLNQFECSGGSKSYGSSSSSSGFSGQGGDSSSWNNGGSNYKKDCATGYYWNSNGYCASCDSKFKQCVRCSPDGFYCYECKNGYHLLNQFECGKLSLIHI